MIDGLTTAHLIFAASMLGAGAVAGLLAGLLGVGGGIVIVPVLFQVFTLLDVDDDVRMHLAVGTSLATIVITASVSTRSHWRRGAVDTALLRQWAPAIVIGVLLGLVFFGSVDSELLSLVFATVALAVAGYMAFAGERESADEDSLPRGPLRYGLALVIGALSAVMGIGGGTLSVPILSLFRYPIRQAVATAAAIGLLIAVPGTIGAVITGVGVDELPPFSFGYVNLLGFTLLVPMTAALAPLGARLAHSIKRRDLRFAFAAFLVVTALNMYATAL